MLDANVLLSAILGWNRPESTPGQLFILWRKQRFIVVRSTFLIGEVERILNTEYFQEKLTADERLEIVRFLMEEAIHTELTVEIIGVASDPNDDPILSTALSGEVDYLVTGDKKLRRCDGFRGLPVITPRAFLDILTAGTA